MDAKDQARLDAAAKQGRVDNYFNKFSGYGGNNDPFNQATFVGQGSLSFSDVDEFYQGHWIFRRAIDVLVCDSTREWVDLKTEDKDLIGEIVKKGKELKIIENTAEALRLARMYGGSILVVGANDGVENIEESLNEDNISEIDFLHPVDMWQLNIEKKFDDPLKPNYREPEIYSIQPLHGESTASRIHSSRVIKFDGAYLPPRKKIANKGWCDSIYVSIVSDLKRFIMSNQTAGQLLQDFITKVLKMPNLMNLIENKDFNSIEARIQYAIKANSNIGLSLIQGGDNGEEYSKIQTPITGYKELMEQLKDIVAAAIGTPKVKLFGQQPGKLSGIDETMKIYDGEVSAFQETDLRTKIERLYSLLLKSKENKKGEPEDWSIEFNPLSKPSNKEKAEAQETQSKADANYVSSGVLMPEEVAASRFTEDGFKYDTILMEVDRSEMNNIEEEEAGDEG
jgi:hypothetical protein